jgi:hypothetical protein
MLAHDMLDLELCARAPRDRKPTGRPMHFQRISLCIASALFAASTLAAEPDFSAIQYGDGLGCGLYVQFLKADGKEALKDGKPTGFFPAGAPPATSPEACTAKCREWSSSSIVKLTGEIYRKSLDVTKVFGTCYLQGKPLSAPTLVNTE